MSKAGRVVRNTSYMLLARITTVVIGIATSVLTARYLGANGLGVLGFALAFSAILSIIVDFGLGTLATREVSRNQTLTGKYLTNVVTMRLCLGGAYIVLIALLVNVMGYPQQTMLVTYIIAVSVVLSEAELRRIDEIMLGAAGRVAEFRPLESTMEQWGDEIPARQAGLP